MNQPNGIHAYDKPVENDFEYVYAENKDKGYIKVTKTMMKVLLGVATKLSELENDKGFVDNTVANLENYYLKTETYSKDELDDKLSLVPRFSVQVVTSLPVENISDTTVYLVPANEDEDNLYTEYINVNGLWEILGAQKIPKFEVTKGAIEDALGYTPADDKKVSELQATINNLPSGGSGLTQAQITALDGMFKKCAYTGDVSAEYTAFKQAFGIESGGDEPIEPDVPEVTLTNISATYTGGEVTVETALTDLKGNTVTAHYSDGSNVTVTDYTLSGTIAEGENIITVSYGGKTTTFTVTGVADVLYGKYWQPSPYQPWTASNLEGTGYAYTENTGTYVDAGLPAASSAKVNEPLQGHIYVRTLTKSQYAIDTAYQVYVNADGKVSTGGFEKLTHARHDKFNGVTETIDVNGTTYYFTMYEWVIPSDKVGIFVSKADAMNNGQFISTNKLSIDEEYKQYYTLFTSDPTDRITEGATEVNA